MRVRVRSAMAFDEQAHQGWCQHIHYETLIADPVAMVRRLYSGFGEEVGSLHARRMHAFLEDRPQDLFGKHRYDPTDFGWSYPGLAEEFGTTRSAMTSRRRATQRKAAPELSWRRDF